MGQLRYVYPLCSAVWCFSIKRLHLFPILTTKLLSIGTTTEQAARFGVDRSPKSANSKPSVCGLRIAVFFALLGLVITAIHLSVNQGLRSIATSNFGSFNRLVAGKVNTEILISGSSRALCHYDPRIIQTITGRTAYNIGMNASQIDLQLGVLQTYLSHNANTKFLIQNLDLFSFETTRRGEIYDPAFFVPYLSEPDLYACLRVIDPNVVKWKRIPLYGYTVEDMRFTWILGLFGGFGFNPPEDYSLGFNPRPGSWTEDFERFRSANPDGIIYRVEEAGIRALESILRLCQSRGIQVILAYSPEYHEMQRLEVNRPEIISRFVTTARSFGVPFWDWSDAAISTQRQFFNNSQHLNMLGAGAFSTEIAHRLRILLDEQSHEKRNIN